MIAIEWLSEARSDLLRLYEFIEPHSSDAAERAIEVILNAVDHLSAFPESGKPWEPDPSFREWSAQFGARAYVIRYRLHGNSLIIVRIWHGLEDR